MPYINRIDRTQFNVYDNHRATNAGELNYVITKLIDEYISRKGKNYAVLNEAIGVLECAKQELYRRVVTPYEETKIIENGDVYTSTEMNK